MKEVAAHGVAHLARAWAEGMDLAWQPKKHTVECVWLQRKYKLVRKSHISQDGICVQVEPLGDGDDAVRAEGTFGINVSNLGRKKGGASSSRKDGWFESRSIADD